MKKNKPAVFLSLLVLAAGCAGSGQVQYADSIDWDAEYDVVVVGFGGAGASASIAAAEAGAKVLLTEKAPLGHEGGNTRYCFQVIRNYHDYNKGIQYVTAEAEGFDHMTSDIIDFIVRGSMENADWLKSLGLPAPEPGSKALGEYPEYPGADQTFAESIVDPSITNGKTYWETMRRGVVERKDKITVWFESPALHLIQDPYTKTVIGVQINHHGTLRKVRALNGVVLACGGFENNEEMVEFYTQRERMYPLGTTYNTGDGVNMALEAGAALWHMNAISGPWITIKTPGMDRAHFNTGMPQNIAKNYAAIYVGKDGARFMNESGWHRHGHIYYSGNFYSQLTPDPIYIIFDESARRAGLDTPPAFGTDLSAEIANGTVIRANTIRELAEKIGVWVDSADPLVSVTHPEWDETYRTVGLENQINAYNRYCADKFDPQFNRRPETLVPISQPPFYALELQPAMVNTQGGARRNIACEVLDPYGKPIPHLYSAGEFGSFYGGVYAAGGNLAETMFSGRTAGRNAARVKPAVQTPVLGRIVANVQVFENEIDLPASASAVLGPNEYLGTASGMGGTLTVKITMPAGKITAVEVIQHTETPGISGPALEKVPGLIVSANSPDVDIVAGATITSRAIINAVKDALAKAQ